MAKIFHGFAKTTSKPKSNKQEVNPSETKIDKKLVKSKSDSK